MIHFEVKMKDYSDLLAKSFLFSSLDDTTLKKALSEISVEVRNYSRNDVIFSPASHPKEIGFMLSGKCEIIRKRSDGEEVLLSVLSATDAFGVLAALSEDNFPTAIIAKNAVKALFIKKDDLFYLVENYRLIAINLIQFLANRISFLNQKIATFSQDNVEDKLVSFLLYEYQKTKQIEIAFNCKKCSETISAGRASVYRALENLVQKKILKHQNKKIIILDLQGLERINK